MIQNKVKSKLIFTEKRFNAGYFLNEDALNSFKLEINTKNCIALSELANVFNPPIFKRQFCQPSERAINYCQSSDVTNALEGSDVYINKKQAEKVGSVVKKNQILVTGFGTIGNTRLVNELSEGTSYANNVCRIESNGKFPYGYLYAFMTTKFGRSQLNKNASGSVVRYIEAPGIKRTLVPILPEEKQQQIHQLIVDSANLRVEANKLLKEAVEFMESQLNDNIVTKGFQHQKISSKSFDYLHKRFDAQYQVMWKAIKDNYSDIEYKKIGDFAENIFVGNRGKRHYVYEGIPFLSSSDMMLFNPLRNSKQISKNSPGLESMKVQKKDILISRSGTVGNTVIVGDYLNNVAISEHALRLRIDSNLISPNYVFTYLKTNVGLKVMEASAFGSVIITLNEELIADIDLPILSKDIVQKIDNLIDNYLIKLDSSTDKENQAINLIENEIDAWQ